MKTFFTIVIGLLVAIVTLSIIFPKQVGLAVVLIYGIFYVVLPIIFMLVKPIRFLKAAEWFFDNFLVYVLWLPLTIILSVISIIGWSLERSAKKARENQKFIEPA